MLAEVEDAEYDAALALKLEELIISSILHILFDTAQK